MGFARDRFENNDEAYALLTRVVVPGYLFPYDSC
jgi:hypothetical protein